MIGSSRAELDGGPTTGSTGPVPERRYDLRTLLGWELKLSLGTTDLREAKLRYPQALKWAQGCVAEARQRLQEQAQEIEHEALRHPFKPTWRQQDYLLRHGGRGDPSREPADLSDDVLKWREPLVETAGQAPSDQSFVGAAPPPSNTSAARRPV